MKQSKKILTTSFLFLLFAEVVYNLSNYFIHAGVGRFIGPAEFGRYSLVVGFASMFTILVARGIPTAMAKKISEHAGQWPTIRAIVRSASRMQAIVIISVTALYASCVPLFVKLFDDQTLLPLFYISVLIIPFFALSSFKVLYFNGLKAFKIQSVIKLTRGLARFFAIVLLAFLFSTEGAVLGAAVAPLIVFLIATCIDYFFVQKPSQKDSAATAKTYPWKNLANYAGTFMLFLILYEFYIRADLYLIKILLGDDLAAGLYTSAMSIALIPYYGIFALTFILFPTISTLAKQRDYAGIRSILKKVFLLMVATLPCAALVFYFFGDVLTTFLYGEKFIAAGVLIPPMLGGTIFGTVFYILASVFNGAGYTKLTAGIVLIGLLISIALNLYYIPLHGTYATALIFSLSSFIMAALALFAAYRIFYVKYR